MRTHARGFTLIELMIVVAIVGILAAIAYPAYRDQVRSSYRADCAGALTSFANAMERYYTMNNAYTGAGPGGADTGAPTIFPTQCPIDGNGPTTYDLRILLATANTYTLQAEIVGGGPMAGDDCGNLRLDNRGNRTVTGTAAVADCW